MFESPMFESFLGFIWQNASDAGRPRPAGSGSHWSLSFFFLSLDNILFQSDALEGANYAEQGRNPRDISSYSDRALYTEYCRRLCAAAISTAPTQDANFTFGIASSAGCFKSQPTCNERTTLFHDRIPCCGIRHY